MIFLMTLALGAADPTWAYDEKGDDIIPAMFQGKWAPSLADCEDEDGVSIINIMPTKLETYDFRTKLLKHAGSQTEHTTTDKMADVVTMLVAESGEGEVSLGKIRLGLVSDKLYLDRPGDKSGMLDTKAGSYVRCAARK